MSESRVAWLRRYIDLHEAEIEAAPKIQAKFRGYRTRHEPAGT